MSWNKITKETKLENGNLYHIRMVAYVDFSDKEKPTEVFVEFYAQWHKHHKVFACLGTGNLYNPNDVDYILDN